ncbi:13232_t:CDS:2, partial [Gigaspora margarita]
QNGFVAIKYYLELDAINKTIISGVHSSKKVEDINLYRDSDTVKINYSWQASFNFGKYATKIWLTKIIDRLFNELTGLFWMTSQQRNELWPKYYDVIIHDNTVKTNRYEMALSIFIGIDNNFKMRILAQALIKYETFADYNWILQKTLEATNNLSSMVLFTNGNPAILAAIQIKEPENNFDNAVEHIYDMLQVRLQELLSNIDSNEVQEIWEINHIVASPKPYYVVLLQSNKAVFHMGFIHPCWFESILSKIPSYIIIAKGVKINTTESFNISTKSECIMSVLQLFKKS